MPIVRIQSPFRRGLSNDNNPNALDSLKEGFGFMCSEAGLVPYESIEYVTEARDVLWAAGRLFRTNSTTGKLEVYNEGSSSFETMVVGAETLGTAIFTLGNSGNWAYPYGSAGISWVGGAVVADSPLAATVALVRTVWTGSSQATAPAYVLEVESEFSHNLASTGKKSEGYITYELYYADWYPSNRLEQYRSGKNTTLMWPYTGSWTLPVSFRILIHKGFVGKITSVALKPVTIITDNLPSTDTWEVANTEHGAILLLKRPSFGHMYFYSEEMTGHTGIVKCSHSTGYTTTIRTVCSHRDGRLYMGGYLGIFLDTVGPVVSYWADAWEQINSDITDKEAATELLGEYIYWSTIGMDEVPDFLLSNILPQDAETIKDRFERNEAGWMRWPFPGKVWAARSLGEDVIFYGEHGILALRPNTAEVPVAVSKVADFGIAGMHTVCATNAGHYFLDHQGALWKMAGQELQYIGYKELLSTLDLDVARLVAHPLKDRVFITDGTDSYFFDNGVLLECPQRINSLVAKDNQLYAAGKNTVGSFTLETGVIDFDSREVKSIRRLTFDGYSGAGWKAKVSRRLQTADWLTTGWLTLPYDGSITGTEFIFELYTSGSSSYYLNSLVVEVDNDPRNYALADWLYTS